MPNALYLRVSTDRQTVDNQRAAALALLSAVGATAPRVVEEVESGAKARPELARLAASLRAGDVLAVWALDRLGRNALEQVILIQGLLARGVRLLSVQEPWIDQPGPVRDLLVSIFAWVAQQERARLVERTRAGLARARAEGKQVGRPRASSAALARAVELAAAGASQVRAAEEAGVSVASFKRELARRRKAAP